jgi:hypothetical protein
MTKNRMSLAKDFKEKIGAQRDRRFKEALLTAWRRLT